MSMDELEVVVPVGPVQSTKDVLSEKQRVADEGIPEDMELVGWELDGWVAGYPLIDANARPVYAYIRPIEEDDDNSPSDV